VIEHVEVEAVPNPGELALQTVSQDGAVVVSLTGELDIRSSPELQDVLAAAQSGDARTVVVDLSGLQFIDSTGLRVLLRAKRHANDGGSELRVRNAPAEVRRLLQIAGVLELLSAERD
jgi:anti-sigma B factor antagonist